MHSYSSGNQRNFGKMSEFEKKYVVLILELIFQLWFYSSFFSIPITFTNFLDPLSGHFFDFLSYIAGNCILVWEVETNFRKIKKCVILKLELIFQFRIYSCFFRFRLPLRTFWTPYRAIFSIFCPKWQEIAFFSVKYSQILLKLRNSLLKGAKIPDILPKFLRFPDE